MSDNVFNLGGMDGPGRVQPDHGNPEGGPLDPRMGRSLPSAPPSTTPRPPAQAPRVPASADDVRAMDPADIPTFTAVAATADRFMSRLPWWAVAAGSAAATWWLLKQRK